MISTKKTLLLLFILATSGFIFFSGGRVGAILFLTVAVFLLFRRKISKYTSIIKYILKLFFKKPVVPVVDRNPDVYKIFFLPGGRRLSYLEHGAQDGCPVFYFHGSPSSCFEVLLFDDENLKEHNIRLIGMNRPGIGFSDIVKGRGVSQIAEDVVCLADNLGIQKFGVLGFSGGAIYVAACCALIPNRVSTAVIISGAWMMNEPEAKLHIKERSRLFWKIADRYPFLLPYILRNFSSSGVDKEKALEQCKRTFVQADYEFIKQGERWEQFNKANDDALYNLKGVVNDALLYVQPLDFDLKDITVPIVMFHGSADRNVPPGLAKTVAERIPMAKLTILENEGHISLLGEPLKEILTHVSGKLTLQANR